MAKSKGNGSIPNKHLYSRLSYLHQAAAFLGSQVEITKPSGSRPDEPGSDEHEDKRPAANQLRLKYARHLMTELRATSLKSQIRLSPAIKHTICKLCDTLLIEGETSTSLVENQSKGARKPWADVLVVRCNTCGGARRFPVNAQRQKRRPQREKASKETPKNPNQQRDLVGETIDVAMDDC
ncbi:Rpr2-domain-containing protein [Xylaria sp. CBS 124048]|nr:Rpr2-domain-containing protein [Xylaria sp. CBS 124048]